MLSEEYLQELATDYFADQWAVDKAIMLIRQMHDALETCDSADGYNGPYQFHDDKAVEAAITAARARLGEKT